MMKQSLSSEPTVQDTIYIVGAGAIGKALAVFLKKAKKNVVLIRGRIDHLPDTVEQVTLDLPGGRSLTAQLACKTISSLSTISGILVFTNKSFGNATLATALREKAGEMPVVLLQNGLGIEQPFLGAGYPHVYRCVLFATSQVVAGNRIRFKPVAASPIGIIKGYVDELQAIVQKLNNPNFSFVAERDIQPVIWTKVIINAVFNSICPLLETDNGIFHRNEGALRIAKGVVNECIGVAKKLGVSLDEETVLSKLLQISKASDGQLISTYQDIKNKRPTEIEALNFAIVSAAKQTGKEASLVKTALLGDLTLLKSELNR